MIVATTLIASGDAVPENDATGLTRVRILWYEDGSIRFRAYKDGPYALDEAYLQGDDPAILRIRPL
jgi:hypothetical protein